MAELRLIDVNALKNLLIEVLEHIKNNPTMKKDEMHIIAGCHMLCEMIDDAPAIDAVPVVHGRWEYRKGGWYCSACKKKAMVDAVGFAKYCCRCGAKMDGGAEG